MSRTDHASASTQIYDAVIVGSGVAGSILANELGRQGFSVLVLEAGPGNDLSIAEYEASVERFYLSASKDNNSPYAVNRNAPMPRGQETVKLQPGRPNADGYIVQNGPLELDSTYTRVVGGTTRHWEGKALRLIPEDFEMRTRHGQGLDWPLKYETLKSYYAKAEAEIGVSADVEDQGYLGISFEPGYVYPMRKIPISYLDQVIGKNLDGAKVELDGETFSLVVRSTPQARNGVPHPGYDNGKGYVAPSAVSTHQDEMGQRCQGNNNCVPICPVQAKYDARRTLVKALETGRVHLLSQTVVSRVHIDSGNGRVTHIEYKAYKDLHGKEHSAGTVKARVFILAANAVENARLMLASGLPGSSGLVGRNLMDHAYLLTWALMPEIVGTMRGSQCTSGIEELRGGAFRRKQAAFRAGIHNDGWGWATGAPYTDLLALVDDQNKFGRALQRGLVDRISRQLLLDFMVEVLPDPANRITVDPDHRDQLGNMRPVLSYRLNDYTLDGVAFARQLSRRIYQRLGAEDHTTYSPQEPGWVDYQGGGFVIRGGNHWAGTHLMGSSPKNSVVDANQRSWDYPNLYLAGSGSMPSIGTANTTLTLAALCLISAGHIAKELRSAPTAAAAR
ncbi:MAG: GMC family oxidoreductase [Planctomycetes bacterium]|nr:GMC family oxidoreductase [Planctomycetota bacterium]